MEKTARRTAARAAGFRCRYWFREGDFGPDGLARIRSRCGAPAVGQRVDEDESPAGLGVGGGELGARRAVTARVGDLDAQSAADHVEREPEVASRYAAVCRRVRRQLGHDVRRRVQRQLPGAELLGGQEAGEAGSAGRRGQEDAEVADGGGGFLIHITQRGHICLP